MKKVIIPAAGKGTRMLPYTKLVPKEILPIINIPSIDFILKECSFCRLTDICFVIDETKNLLVDHIFLMAKTEYPDLNVCFLQQKEQQGTANAIEICKDFVGADDFGVIFPDEISFFDSKYPMEKVLERYNETNSFVLGGKRVPINVANLYGMIEFRNHNHKNGTVKKICEKPSGAPPSEFALCGRYICKNEIFNCLGNLSKHGKEKYITDAFNYIATTTEIFFAEIEGNIYDIGTPENYANTLKIYCEKVFNIKC